MILGIDPGSAVTGFGVIETNGDNLEAKSFGVIKTSPQKSRPERLYQIYKEIKALIDKFKPQEFVLEQLFVGSNLKTALAVGEARGAALVAAAEYNLKTSEYTPLQVKQAVVGYGQAKKEQVGYMVKKFLNLRAQPKFDDAADALALSICHAHSHKLLEKINDSKAPMTKHQIPNNT